MEHKEAKFQVIPENMYENQEQRKPKTKFEKFTETICGIFPWYVKPVELPPNSRDLGLVLQKAHFGDVLLLRTKTKLDSAISVCPQIYKYNQ